MQIMNTKKAADGHVGPKDGSLQRRGLREVLLATAVLLAFGIIGQLAYAGDELRLIGVVKAIDPKAEIVFVDVQSESCPGIRRFHADDLGAFGKYVNQTITFHIDSSICSDTAIHSIVVSRGIK